MGANRIYKRICVDALGWVDYIWDKEELQGIAYDCWQMSLDIRPIHN